MKKRANKRKHSEVETETNESKTVLPTRNSDEPIEKKVKIFLVFCFVEIFFFSENGSTSREC